MDDNQNKSYFFFFKFNKKHHINMAGNNDVLTADSDSSGQCKEASRSIHNIIGSHVGLQSLGVL